MEADGERAPGAECGPVVGVSELEALQWNLLLKPGKMPHRWQGKRIGPSVTPNEDPSWVCG